ncbi:MAG: hypothetical protein MZW92_24310 [Comamonadaceae bacterium]|nr:hypothetical protein [Comamonadaceae bacterium]
MASLAPTFGRGAMTNHWVDIKNADLVLIMGGNAAEAHPCGFKWVTEAKEHNKAKLDRASIRASRARPRWPTTTRRSAPGTDIAFLGGVINYLLANDKIQHEYVQGLHRRRLPDRARTSSFEDGLFTGYDDDKRSYDKADLEPTSWTRTATPRSTRRCRTRAASTS